MTANERTTLAARCARCDGTPDAQRLLAELRAQLEEARRERDEARLAAEQGVKVAEALATEKAALLSRVAVLEAALRVLHPERLDFDAHSDECLECRSSYSCDSDMEPTPECHQCAHVVLERARSAARAALEVEP